MPIKTVITKGRVPVKVYTDQIEHSAYQQMVNMAQMPFIHSHIAAMPDVHMGKGATVGSVIPTIGAIIPAAVGVDIGCGMNAMRLSLRAEELPDDLRRVRTAIEAAVPLGFNMHTKIKAKRSTLNSLDVGLEQIVTKHPGILKMQSRKPYIWAKQLGSLGGGNHFIELCIDENEAVWIMLHSGSRGIGNVIGRYFIQLAKKEMRAHQINFPDRDLAYLQEGTLSFSDYVFAVNWAQEYAMINRREMMRLIVDALRGHLPEFNITKEAINCHHNYISEEFHYGEESAYLHARISKRKRVELNAARTKASWMKYRPLIRILMK